MMKRHVLTAAYTLFGRLAERVLGAKAKVSTEWREEPPATSLRGEPGHHAHEPPSPHSGMLDDLPLCEEAPSIADLPSIQSTPMTRAANVPTTPRPTDAGAKAASDGASREPAKEKAKHDDAFELDGMPPMAELPTFGEKAKPHHGGGVDHGTTSAAHQQRMLDVTIARAGGTALRLAALTENGEIAASLIARRISELDESMRAATAPRAPAHDAPAGSAAAHSDAPTTSVAKGAEPGPKMPQRAAGRAVTTAAGNDAEFCHRAITMLAAALLTPSVIVDEKDEELALATAGAVARFLDTGKLPPSYVMPEAQAAIATSLYYQHAWMGKDGKVYPIGGSVDRSARELQMMQHEKKHGKLKTVKEVQASNEELLSTVKGLSKQARDAALASTSLRFAAMGKTITGFHADEAIAIAVQEAMRSISIAERCGVKPYADEPREATPDDAASRSDGPSAGART